MIRAANKNLPFKNFEKKSQLLLFAPPSALSKALARSRVKVSALEPATGGRGACCFAVVVVAVEGVWKTTGPNAVAVTASSQRTFSRSAASSKSNNAGVVLIFFLVTS